MKKNECAKTCSSFFTRRVFCVAHVFKNICVLLLTHVFYRVMIPTSVNGKLSRHMEEAIEMNTIGCIRARLGSTDYFIGKMKAGQIIDSVGFAMEMQEWDSMTADEKMQRTLDVNRVVTDIVPYVIEDPDKFFGSLIVDIYQGYDEMQFESVAEVIPSLPAAYKMPLKDMGFLTLPGNERLIALDGQHRLLALKVAIKGVMGLPASMNKMSPSWSETLKPHPELANEEISVLFVEHTETTKIRKIFNKVNRYARQTSRSDNIITSDDDIYAVITRRLISPGEPLASINGIDVVNWKNNTLSARSKHLTTLSALYTMAETLLRDEKLSTKMLPDPETVESSYKFVSDFWRLSLDKIDAFRKYINLTYEDKPISGLRESNLLLKPVTQMALAHTARMAKSKGIAWEDVTEKLNKIDWSFDNSVWFNILIIPSANKKMITGKEAIRGAGMVISYIVMGDKMTADEINDVKQIICNARDDSNAELPARV